MIRYIEFIYISFSMLIYRIASSKKYWIFRYIAIFLYIAIILIYRDILRQTFIFFSVPKLLICDKSYKTAVPAVVFFHFSLLCSAHVRVSCMRNTTCVCRKLIRLSSSASGDDGDDSNDDDEDDPNDANNHCYHGRQRLGTICTHQRNIIDTVRTVFPVENVRHNYIK